MKKIYVIPTSELIDLDTEGVMVPNKMSNPGVGANRNLFFDEEEEKENEENENPDRLNNSF